MSNVMKLMTTKKKPVSVIMLGAIVAGKKVANFVQKGLRMYFEVRDLSCPAYLYSCNAAKWPFRM